MEELEGGDCEGGGGGGGDDGGDGGKLEYWIRLASGEGR